MRPDDRFSRRRQARRAPAGGALRFAACALVLVGLIVLVWWLGWRSPWARRPMEVRVEIAPPKAR